MSNQAIEEFEFPVSATQATFWYMYQLDPEATAYTISLGFRINGNLDPDVMRRAFEKVIERHEILRTTYREKADGQLVQRVTSESRMPFKHVLIESDNDEDLDEELNSRMESEFRRPVLIDEEPVLRAVLYQLAPNSQVLLLNIHHIAVDHLAIGTLLSEMAEYYQQIAVDDGTELRAPDLQYADYVMWQIEQRESVETQARKDAWRSRLDSFSGILNLPETFPRPKYQSFAGRDRYFRFDKTTSDQIRAFSKSRGLSLFFTILACLATVYQRYSRQSDIIIGTPFSDRNQNEQLEEVLGCFINTLPLATRFEEDVSFNSLLLQVKEVMMDAFDNQIVPLEDIVHELGIQRDISRNPLFQVGFVFQEPPMTFAIPGTTITPMEIPNYGAMYDLHTFMWEDDGVIGGLLTYNSDLFDSGFVDRFLATFEVACRNLIDNPDVPVRSVEMLSAADASLIDRVNSTETPFDSSASVVDLFQRAAAKHSESVAVCDPNGKMTYSELNETSSKLAAHLVARGVEQGDLVGIAVDRGCHMLAALIAIWKAGAAYVPLDPEYPNDRLAFMMQEAGVRHLVTQSWISNDLPNHECERVLLDTEWDDIQGIDAPDGFVASSGEDAAYVIFTSGSTGLPKGVQVPHRSVVNFLESMAVTPGIGSEDSLLAVTTLSFDIAVLELYLPVCNGARVVVATSEQAADGRELVELVRTQSISLMQATPSTWRLMLAEGWLDDAAAERCKVLCGGEAFPSDLAKALAGGVAEVWNMYGPTESTVWSTCKRIDKDDTYVSIGRPLANTAVHVLNESGVRVPLGVPGALHISGAGLATGYLGRPDLTEASFIVNNELNVDRIYATGDLVTMHPNGDLEFLQRLDGQVKLRGYRIELGEIESVLADAPGVDRVVANIWHGASDDRRLVAYIVPKVGKVNAIKLRKHLRASVPDYMVPQHFVELQDIPLTNNGKVDRKALPSPLGLSKREARQSPEGPVEESVAAIWKEILGDVEVFKDDHFFDIGGHSLLAVKVISRAEQEFGVRLNPRMIVMHSLSEIADEIVQRGAQG